MYYECTYRLNHRLSVFVVDVDVLRHEAHRRMLRLAVIVVNVGDGIIEYQNYSTCIRT